MTADSRSEARRRSSAKIGSSTSAGRVMAIDSAFSNSTARCRGAR